MTAIFLPVLFAFAAVLAVGVLAHSWLRYGREMFAVPRALARCETRQRFTYRLVETSFAQESIDAERKVIPFARPAVAIRRRAMPVQGPLHAAA